MSPWVRKKVFEGSLCVGASEEWELNKCYHPQDTFGDFYWHFLSSRTKNGIPALSLLPGDFFQSTDPPSICALWSLPSDLPRFICRKPLPTRSSKLLERPSRRWRERRLWHCVWEAAAEWDFKGILQLISRSSSRSRRQEQWKNRPGDALRWGRCNIDRDKRLRIWSSHMWKL